MPKSFVAASIMSKKLAVCNKGLVLDVKVGSGAFMKTVEDARKLASLMVKIGAQAGRKVAAVLTNMDEPLGEMVGNACEIIEAMREASFSAIGCAVLLAINFIFVPKYGYMACAWGGHSLL